MVKKLIKSLVHHPQIKMYKFEKNVWSKTEDKEISLEKFKILSFNVLHDLDRLHITCPKIRYDFQMILFENLNSDFLGLNEVTPNYLKLLTSTKFIQENYYLSNINFDDISTDHCCILLSKYPMKISSHSIETLDRKVVIGELKIKDKNPIVICVAHTLAYERNYLSRKFQMEKIFELLDSWKSASSFLIGDLNLHQLFEDEYIRDDYIDSWAKIRKDEGYTYDSINNKLIYEKLTISMEYRRMRLDRILYKSKEMNVKSIDMFGNEPIFKTEVSNSFDPIYYLRWTFRSIISLLFDAISYNIFREPKEYLYPSDHFGLIANFSIE